MFTHSLPPPKELVLLDPHFTDKELRGAAGPSSEVKKPGRTACALHLFFFLIEVQLIYSVVLVAAVQQNDSVIHTYIYPFSYSFPLWFITGY